ncbi:hypothetical protein [uncultured Leifsonia sp.]|uniref:hypothetical protein n=1 Tax=uncultured Leifsonia sp. TaxID=340359 RepID=UPI0025D20FDD|nr:hypothetical protein [uncultured Leifsonia sp.]
MGCRDGLLIGLGDGSIVILGTQFEPGGGGGIAFCRANEEDRAAALDAAAGGR